MEKIEQLQKMINTFDNIVFFSGAGVSTDSGIKDFRSKDGLYSQETKYKAEYMLSADMFYRHTEEFYDYYRKNLNCLNAKPNVIHKYIKKLEEKGKNITVVTQNIDGLHTKAGSSKVYEIHGTIYKNHCLNCHKSYEPTKIFQTNGIVKCKCGGLIKPDVVLYEEALPDCFISAEDAINKCEMLIVIGTSLTVEPASSLVRLFKGKYLVIINNTETNYDKYADLVIHDKLKNIFEKLK